MPTTTDEVIIAVLCCLYIGIQKEKPLAERSLVTQLQELEYEQRLPHLLSTRNTGDGGCGLDPPRIGEKTD